jgi:hypothetical protein
MSNPRSIALDTRGNILAVERGVGITGHFVDRGKSGRVGKRKVVVEDAEINHGLDVGFGGDKIYATYVTSED